MWINGCWWFKVARCSNMFNHNNNLVFILQKTLKPKLHRCHSESEAMIDLSRFDRFSGVSLLGVPVLSTLSEPVLFLRVFILKSVGSSEHSELLIAATSSFWRLGLSKSNNNDLLAKFGAEAVETFWWFVEKDLLRPLEWAGGTMSVFGEDAADDEAGDMLEVWRLGDGSTDFESG